MPSPDPELEALRRENERLRLLAARDRRLLDSVLAQSPHGVIMCDAEGRLVLQNEAAERMWAGSATAETVEEWGQYRAFHPDGRPYEGSDWAMAACLETREPEEPHEYRIQRFDGTFGWLLGSAAPLFDDDGSLLGAVSVFADVSELKEREADNRRRALEINDDVVQSLSAARLSVELDRTEEALAALEAALAAARKIVNDLLADAGADLVLGPGHLRRSQAAGG
ncbi:MAG TPA: PAS domain-containing protein [Gaiellaceae bacterium]|nr:PAS domain-containing protein [Gaiellaceae bacterium]